MARVKLSEFRAKSLLVPEYHGYSLRLGTLDKDIQQLDSTVRYVVKVDQGIKKRGKQGLLRIDVAKDDVATAVNELAKKGFSRFIAEPLLPHDDNEEQYVSFDRTRDGILMSYSKRGGIDIEDNAGSVQTFLLSSATDLPLKREFIDTLTTVMDEQQLSFVEINPLVVQNNQYFLLDAAVMADSAGEHLASWSDADVVEASTPTDAEAAIAELNQNSSAAFSFRVLNPDGALWLLLSGGGASITIADEAHNQGKAKLVGNYGEYSGGPSAEETYLYTCEVLKQLIGSKAPRKAVIIAGGVANFTDVRKTFGGVIRALKESQQQLQEQAVKVYVRRGGPNEAEGLVMMRAYLEEAGLFGSVHGSDIVLTDVIHEALEYVDA